MDRLSADVVVVGSGAGGAAVAGELARRGVSVVLVEAGPQLTERPGASGRNRFPSEDDLPGFVDWYQNESLVFHAWGEPLDGLPGARVAHAVGGMLTHWTNNCPDPHPTLERVPCVDPESWSALLDRARALLHISVDLVRDGVRQRRLLERLSRVLPSQPDERPVQALPIAARRSEEGLPVFSGADGLLLGSADEFPGSLRILDDTVAQRLEHAGSTVTGVTAYSRSSGEQLLLTGDVVVVAAGAIGTPQLLLASDIDAGPALGRYLGEHPLIVSRVLLDAELRDGAPSTDLAYGVWIPMSESRPWHAQVLKIGDRADFLPAGTTIRDTVDVQSLCGIDPSPDNRIFLDDRRKDAFGLPAVRAELRLSWADRERIAGTMADQSRIAATLGSAEAGFATELTPLGSAFHLTGTYRMGEADDGESVTDPSCLAWRYENLFLAGNGLIPTRTACNPTLMTVALGLRCADAILAGPGLAGRIVAGRQ